MSHPQYRLSASGRDCCIKCGEQHVCLVQLQAAAEVEDFVQEMKRCYRLPHGQKPDMQQWQSSRYAHRILALQAFALDNADPAEAVLAIQMVQVCTPCSMPHWEGEYKPGFIFSVLISVDILHKQAILVFLL